MIRSIYRFANTGLVVVKIGSMANQTLNEIRAQRLNKLDAIRAAGVDPYPRQAFAKRDVVEILTEPVDAVVEAAGRVMLFRDMGNIAFFQLQDRSGRIQGILNKRTFPGDYKFWSKSSIWETLSISRASVLIPSAAKNRLWSMRLT
jgi:lysyl-tRNA synthetase class II